MHNVDFLIYKKNHVLYKNFNREIEIEILNKIINQKPMSQKKQVSKEKDSLINNHPEVQPEEIKKVLNEKRKSYRQKADELSKKKSGYKVKNKIPKASTQNIDAMKDQESTEKRQGWWNQ